MAVVTGFIARGKVRERGEGMATAGIAIGALLIVLSVVYLLHH